MPGPSCSLSASAVPERRQKLAALLAASPGRIVATDRVVRFEELDPSSWRALADLVELERACCASLAFDLTARAHGGPVRLTVRGPRGTRAFLASWLPAGTLPEPGRWRWRAGVAALMGGGAVALCCATPLGLAVAAAVGVSAGWLDAVAVFACLVGLVLIVTPRVGPNGRSDDGSGCSC